MRGKVGKISIHENVRQMSPVVMFTKFIKYLQKNKKKTEKRILSTRHATTKTKDAERYNPRD